MNINELFKQLAEYTRIAEETDTIIEGLKDEIKTYMAAEHLEELAGNEHKATYKAVTSNRIDTAAIKRDLPDIATKYTTSSSSMRFTFA